MAIEPIYYDHELTPRELANELWEVNRRLVSALAQVEVVATREEQQIKAQRAEESPARLIAT